VNSVSSQSRRGTHVFYFAFAAGMLAFAQAGAAEVEAEDGESEAVERFHGVEDDFVVQRSAVQRMRMADYGACVAVGDPALSSASRRPAGPARNKERMLEDS
jgi:hypothetical protein